ncbi:MAG: hypothetical protein NXI32_27635 [bacterium]|nr:hypothetical protein [bacterium]
MKRKTTRAKATASPQRKRLKDTRRSITHKFQIDQLEGYITVGLYDDETPGEVFIKIAKHGSTISGLVDTIAVLTSLALQYGVPVEDLARKFEFTRFDPAGWSRHPEIHRAHSLVDYVFRWLGLEFCESYRQEKTQSDSPAEAATESAEEASVNKAENVNQSSS